jgi:FkbM family methyltransferase
MNIDDFIILLKKEIQNLIFEFEENNEFFFLKINEKKIKFKKTESSFSINQNNWFYEIHKDNEVFEKGLIATISLLGKIINKKIFFYDIGALFGYHTMIARSLLKNIHAVTVEGNPHSQKVLEHNVLETNNVTTINAFLSDNNSKKNYYIDLFNFWEADGYSGLVNSLGIRLKNYLKTFLNFFGKDYKITYDFKKYEIRSTTLREIYSLNSNNDQEIYKIDAEGTQCVFLKPFIKELSEKNAIILLEQDAPHYMAKFGMTNNEMLKLFLDINYKAIWLDHREPNKIVEVKYIEPSMDRNSFLILLPKNFFV